MRDRSRKTSLTRHSNIQYSDPNDSITRGSVAFSERCIFAQSSFAKNKPNRLLNLFATNYQFDD